MVFQLTFAEVIGQSRLHWLVRHVITTGWGRAGYISGATFELSARLVSFVLLRNPFSVVKPSTPTFEFYLPRRNTMAASFRELLGIRPGTASTSDSALIIIDAQNEYAKGHLKVTNAESSGKAIASLVEKYRAAGGKIVHVMHQTPEGAPIFTPGTELANEFSNVAAKVGLRYDE